VTLDGDGQHNPDEIPQVLAPILRGEADLVIGSRFLQPNLNQSQPVSNSLKHVPKYRKFGIDVITWLYNFGSKVKVSDSQSCFRAHSRRVIEAINITENGFSFSVQVLIQARRKNFVIREVPVSCIYHLQGSSLNPVAHGLGVAWGVVKLRLRNELLAPKRRNKDELKE
jgi:glycosyltransferase involved in cell wall biosynthesis